MAGIIATWNSPMRVDRQIAVAALMAASDPDGRGR
jgi:hypothetical protein